tara:strand:- start:281 stop:505 length:225 start_codon:yes stop_codon:yes gene_type:complete
MQGVAISLMLFLLSSVTFIMGKNQNNKSASIQISQAKKNMTPTNPKSQNIIESDDWQEASIEDIRSGHYHIYNP